jgi:hypothetical protein
MNPDFRLHYDRLRENDPTKPENGTNEAGTFYDAPGHARNLCLVWPDGKRKFLSYAYLVGGTFNPGEETQEIVLDFSAYKVTLKGYGLKELFTALLDHLPKTVVQEEERYQCQGMGTETTVVKLVQVEIK